MKVKERLLRSCCIVGALVFGLGLVAQPLATAALSINETDADTLGADTLEFIEIYNSGPGIVDFAATPHVVVLFNGSTAGADSSYMAVDLIGTLAVGGYFVIGSTGMGTDIELAPGGTGWFQNGADAVGLYTGTSAAFPPSTLATQTNLVDAIVYDTNDPDDTALLALLGESVQYNEDQFGTRDTTSISRTPDGGPFTPGQTPTPGSANGLAAPVVLSRLTLMQVNNTNVAVDLCATGGTGALTFNVDSLPANGTLSDGSGAFVGPRPVSGSLTYTPNPGYSGLDTFLFSATDTQPATSDPETHELGVQQATVAISEIMHSPTGDDRVFEYIEIYNLSASPVALTRMDTSRRTTTDTTDNLTSNGTPIMIPGNSMRIIASDATSIGIANEVFQCEWNIFEADIIRIDMNQFETMFASPDAVNCAQSDGSRLLLFGAGDVLLDGVDLGRIGSASDLCAGASFAYDDLFGGPLSTLNNDDTVAFFAWDCATVLPGLRPNRPGTNNDNGNPGFVPGELENYVYDAPCFGACCKTDGTCGEGLTSDECFAAICGNDFGGLAARYSAGEFCATQICTLETIFACCLPIGDCVELTDCECTLLGGNNTGNSTCVGEMCPIEVAIAINELDYDNDGSDTSEFLELKELQGAVNVSLAGWTIEFHNGNAATTGFTLLNNKTINLATMPGGQMPADGYLVIGPSTGTVPNVDLPFPDGDSGEIQNGGVGINGNGDGIVLLFNGSVVEALSYDTGSTGFTARGGAADGAFLADIGIIDSPPTGSLQKIPDAGAWTETINTTPGEANFVGGACCLLNGTCSEDVTSTGCTGLGGIYEGDGTACATVLCERCVAPGDDCWVTQCGLTGYGFVDTPIPADFFAPGSDPFVGTIGLGGTGNGPLGSDTTMSRLTEMCFSEPFPDVQSTGIQLVALNLVSCNPITVTSNGDQNPELWDVAVDLSGTPVVDGLMTVTKTHANGGTFSTVFDVQPLFTFTKVSDPGQVRVFDTGALAFPPVQFTGTDQPWLHDVPCPTCSPDFAPGVQLVDNEICREDICHESLSAEHLHCVIPVDCLLLLPCPPTGACCLPNGDCQDDVTSFGCASVGGVWQGEGSVCPDIAAFVGCVTGPNGGLLAGCDAWDLDVDGDVDLADYAILQRTLVVCEPPQPGEVLINEIWANDTGADDNEFIELFGTPGASLGAYSLIIVDGDAGNYRNVNLWLDLSGQSLDGNGFFVVGNGPAILPAPDATLEGLAVLGANTNGLPDEIQNGSQTYALVLTADVTVDSNGVLTDASALAIAMGAIDLVGTRDSALDDLYFGAPEVLTGAGSAFGYAQRLPNGTDTNSAADFEALDANEIGDMGGGADPSTPHAVNASQNTLTGACCTGGTACQEALTPADCTLAGGDFVGFGQTCTPNPCECVSIAAAEVNIDGTPVCITGAIITRDLDNVGSINWANFYLEDPVGTNGIVVFASEAEIAALLSGAGAVMGDAVEVRGELDTFFTDRELVAGLGTLSMTVLSSPGVPAAFPRSIASFPLTALATDPIMSTLVVLENVEFALADQGQPFVAAFNYTINDVVTPANTMVLRIGNSTNPPPIVGTTIPSGPVDIVGITTAFGGIYQIAVFFDTDITPYVP